MRAILILIVAASVCPAQVALAERLIEAGHWKRARDIVERRLQGAPDDPEANFLASQVRNAFGDHTAPLALAEEAVRLDGGVARYHRQLAEVQGVMAQHAGMFQQIGLAHRFHSEIDAALALDPYDAQALRDLVEFCLLAPGLLGGDAKKAESIALRIAAIDPPQGLLAQARIAESRKDPAAAKALLSRAAAAQPRSYKALIAYANFCLAPEHRDEAAAEAAAKDALSLDSGRTGAYRALASIFAGRANWNGLDSMLAAAARAVPDDSRPITAPLTGCSLKAATSTARSDT